MIHEEFGLTLKDAVVSENQENMDSDDISGCTLPVATGKPVNLIDFPHCEEKAFPWLFPYGRNGISADRPSALSILKYFQTRSCNVDPRWRTDIVAFSRAQTIFNDDETQLIGFTNVL